MAKKEWCDFDGAEADELIRLAEHKRGVRLFDKPTRPLFVRCPKRNRRLRVHYIQAYDGDFFVTLPNHKSK